MATHPTSLPMFQWKISCTFGETKYFEQANTSRPPNQSAKELITSKMSTHLKCTPHYRIAHHFTVYNQILLSFTPNSADFRLNVKL
mmetsp:Transcript_35803/g.106861  ORF Transcript_35803/g.106861 Transcript_35803/m.106861 type:complete len:86 (-) Transcript_35803:618-875(-)